MIAVPGWANPDEVDRYGLSPRQVDVLAGMAKGMTNAAIARALGLSEDTVKTHAKRLYKSLQATDRCSAVAMAYDVGVLRTREQRLDAARAVRLRVVA